MSSVKLHSRAATDHARRWSVLLLIFAAAPLWAVDDAATILKRVVAAEGSYEERAKQYTYQEDVERFTYQDKGKLHKNRSDSFEIVFVEGLEYRRLIARNGKPLSPKEQAQVEMAMHQTADERRKHRPPAAPGGRISYGSQQADLGSTGDLLALFDNRLVGEEEVRGRKSWVIESTPKAGHTPASQHEKEVLCFKKKTWIDEAENVIAWQIVTVVREGIFPKPGSSITFQFDKVGPDTWHPVSIVLDTYLANGKKFEPTSRTEYKLSRFRKFDVQSTITVDVGKQ
jgi:hypothetical protein